jgi:hypothetical protein
LLFLQTTFLRTQQNKMIKKKVRDSDILKNTEQLNDKERERFLKPQIERNDY